EVVVCAGTEVAGVDRPSDGWNRDADLPFLITFAVQRQERHVALACVGEQRSGERIERGRLVVLPVEASHCPGETGEPHSCAEARARCVLDDLSVEKRLTNSC